MVAITQYRDPGLIGLQRLNRMLDEAFAGWAGVEPGTAITSTLFAPTDVTESPESLQITMEVPGVRSEDVKISLENNLLTIRGEKRQEAEEKGERVHRYERSYGTFERTFVLPNTVDPERIEARYGDGILAVTIPKAERARPREIPVSASAAGGSTPISTRTGGGPSSLSRDPEEEGSAGKTPR
ncbi:MAG TPA: Hsp20/alpha crystallin family protein [Gemmatimonadales bacterium]|nr:Hsp20/alpha crystallin family protein [Gemmatimonadales bacterium]